MVLRSTIPRYCQQDLQPRTNCRSKWEWRPWVCTVATLGLTQFHLRNYRGGHDVIYRRHIGRVLQTVLYLFLYSFLPYEKGTYFRDKFVESLFSRTVLCNRIKWKTCPNTTPILSFYCTFSCIFQKYSFLIILTIHELKYNDQGKFYIKNLYLF